MNPAWIPSPSAPLPLAESNSPEPATPWRWANHPDDVRAAQRLRHAVLAHDGSAQTTPPSAGLDTDLFDDFCEHLLVFNGRTGELIGTCRVLTPAQAKRVGSTHTDTAFDLTRLRGVREQLVEVGRVCVHPAHRSGAVLSVVWRAVGTFMRRNRLPFLIGCASLPLHPDGRLAASVWRRMQMGHLAPIDWQVRARLPLAVERLDSGLNAPLPALLQGFLSLGGQVLGPPAWNPDFNTADLPLLLRMADLPARQRNHLGGAV